MREPIVDQFQIPITAGGEAITAVLRVPERAKALVLFGGPVEIRAEDDPVVHALEFDGYATLRLPASPLVYTAFAGTEPLGRRLIDATTWAKAYDQTRDFPIGLFGRGVGADACLIAAAGCRRWVRAVVAYEPRPDQLAVELASIHAPIRIIAREDDDALIQLNRSFLDSFGSPADLRIVPGSIARGDPSAGALMGRMVVGWFDQYVTPPLRADTPEARGIPPGYWPAG